MPLDPKTAQYFRVQHTKLGQHFHQGDVVTREELTAEGATITRLFRLGSIEPLYDEPGAEEYHEQMTTGRRMRVDLDDELEEREPASTDIVLSDEDKQWGDLPPVLPDDPNTQANTPSGKDLPVSGVVAGTGTSGSNSGDQYEAMNDDDLRSLGASLGVSGTDKMDRAGLLTAVRKATGGK